MTIRVSRQPDQTTPETRWLVITCTICKSCDDGQGTEEDECFVGKDHGVEPRAGQGASQGVSRRFFWKRGWEDGNDHDPSILWAGRHMHNPSRTGSSYAAMASADWSQQMLILDRSPGQRRAVSRSVSQRLIKGTRGLGLPVSTPALHLPALQQIANCLVRSGGVRDARSAIRVDGRLS